MSCSRALNFLRIVFCVASAWTTMTHAQMPPAFDRILPPVDIDVNQATTLTLGQVSCLDPENNVTAVTLDPPLPSSPCGACFSVSNCPGSASDWCLTFDPVDRLDLTSVPEYTLVLTCEDADGLSDSMAVKVRVVKVAKPPVFVGLASVLTLVEKETQKLTMDTFNCTDPNDDQVKVSLGDVTPTIGKCASCFSVLPCGTEWCLVYLPSAGDLEFADTASYVVTVRCSDVDGNVTSSSVDVRLTTNSPPVFNISGMTDTHTVRNAKNVKAGATIYEVATYDPNPSDRVFYTMTSTPDNGNFDIGYSDGIIRASSDLSQECTSDVTFEVFADDRVNTPVGPFVVSVTLDGANQSPSITNMDETVQLEEEKAGDFYTIQVTDDGDVRDLAYTLAANPASALGFFSITSSKPPHLRVTGGLDYEDLSHRRVTLTLEAKDKGGCSTGVKRLIVEVTDVNEEPVFDHNPVTLTVYEGHITVADDKWKVLDPDAHESLSFALVKSSYPGMFGVDSKTGTIESLSDYDVDKNRMPDTVTLTLEVTDKGDLKDQTEVTLNVLDANDNRPKIRDVSKSFTVTECTSPGTVLGSLYVTDDDSSFQGNNQTYFRPTTSRPIAVLANGNVVLTSAMSAGATASISVYASDQGQYPGPLQSQGPAFVGVSAKVCPTPPPPPPPTPAPTPAPTTTTTTT
ncbi:protocadherin-1, partial [Aplysia californica]|uniref:Protocadherin-1 n=1 Tax=Aplysia californica TaxID=6500 RepID=A0ABM0ZVS5_APLCA